MTRTDVVPANLRSLAEARIDATLRKLRSDLADDVRIAQLSRGVGLGHPHPAATAIGRESVGRDAIAHCAEVVWTTSREVFASAGMRYPIAALQQVIDELPDRLEIVKQWVFDENRPSLERLGVSVGFAHLNRAQAEVLDDLTYRLGLLELEARARDAVTIAALSAPRYAGPRKHWEKANDFIAASDPDIENAVKEAVAAVEGLAKIILDAPDRTLGDCLKDPRLTSRINPKILPVIRALWGYASSESGIRHAGLGAPASEITEAEFAIDVCAATIQLLLRVDGTETIRANR